MRRNKKRRTRTEEQVGTLERKWCRAASERGAGSVLVLPVKEGFTRSRFNRGVEQNPLQAALARYKYKYQVVNSMGGGADPASCFIQSPWKSKKRGRKKIEGKM